MSKQDKNKDKKRAIQPVEQEEPPEAREDDASEGSSPEGELVGGGVKGAAVGGFLGGPAGAAIGGMFGLVGGALRDGEKKRRRW
jgi:hypothetical protein